MPQVLDITDNRADYRFCRSCDLYFFMRENTCPKCGGTVKKPERSNYNYYSRLMIYTFEFRVNGHTYLAGRDARRKARYRRGYRYCASCMLFFKTDSYRCPLCHRTLRTHSAQYDRRVKREFPRVVYDAS